MAVKIELIDQAIEDFYSKDILSERLIEAILYSVNAGGKRIRPLILLEVVEAFGLTLEASHYQVAAAVELIHTASLIHDDLPAMDDDDYRRGRLTNHKQFDQATAILAGDSLFLDPFALLAEADLKPEIKLALIKELSYASGSYGMVAGQMLDMAGEGRTLDLTALAKIHANKTGKLLTFPFVAAGLLVGLDQAELDQLREAGRLVGLAFQVRDDILDVTADFDQLGKTPQKDLSAQKATYPSLLGLERSYDILNDALNQAQDIFDDFESQGDIKQTAIRAILERLRLYA